MPVMLPKSRTISLRRLLDGLPVGKTLLLNKRPGNILGCDFSGTVVEIGGSVLSGRYLGKRVAGFVHGGIEANDSFSEYVVTGPGMVIRIPDDMIFENAAQLGVACLTVCQALYQCLGLPTPLEPESKPRDLLVLSGTSATGQYAIQFAKLAGLRVISTASPRKRRVRQILGSGRATGGVLSCAIDCISEGMTPYQVSMSLGEKGGTIATLLPYRSRRKDVETVFILDYTCFGKDVEFPFQIPANSEHHVNAERYFKMVAHILATLPIKPVPVRLYPHGLASVQ
ncbi:hypothetical protein C8J57DRAFT_1441124 [Mycena rebaudengoi]|nr:hypothetical protein C8J57DRAFT_1441124 [Mycena rebaudengoi]